MTSTNCSGGVCTYHAFPENCIARQAGAELLLLPYSTHTARANDAHFILRDWIDQWMLDVSSALLIVFLLWASVAG